MSDDARPIRLLPKDLRDQIAAGEVVERPASVVKELVENAFDAGARSVRVEIDGGGLDRILVSDDGDGMDEASALLALERHATSKIARFDDLYALATFGFRGEALPSIASVSRFTLTTKRADSLGATRVEVIGGGDAIVREAGAPTGTTIEVRDLFFNVPARRKFLKAVATEAAHVSDTILELSLSKPEVALTLVRDGRQARQLLRAADRVSRARDALGRGAEDLVSVVAERPRVRIEALLSPPERARSGATSLHLVVNDRVVRDRALARAVAMAYGSILEPGRYPVGVVYLDVPPNEVDVNVHPQKAEVRFSRGRELFDDVTRALGTSLASALAATRSDGSFLESGAASRVFPTGARPRSDPAAAPTTQVGVPSGPAPAHTLVGAAMFDLSNAMAKANATTPITTATDRASAAQTRRPELTSSREPSVAAAPNTLFDDDERPPVSDAPTAASSDRGAPNAVRAAGSVDVVTTLVSADPRANEILDAVAREQAAHARGHYGALKLLAQVRNTFLVCEGPDGILVIDQHAAAERVNFDRLRKQAQSRSVERQQLLVPETVDLTSVEAALVDDARDEILALGLDARRIGDTRAAIHGVPALLKRGRPAQLLRDLVDELGRTGSRRFGDAIDLVLATLACHGSVRAGDPLHVSECVALLQALDGVDFARHCPHGRPILAALSYGELEKKVGRR